MLNPFQDVLSNHQDKETLERYAEKFKPKLFFYQYRKIARLSRLSSFFFNLLSVVSGLAFLSVLFQKAIYENLYLAGSLALVLLIVWEAVKREIFPQWCTDYLSTGKVHFWLIAANLFFVSGSVLFSVKGAKEIILLSSKAPGLIDLKEIESRYQSQTEGIEAKIKALIKRNTWKDQTYLPASDRALNDAYEAQIREIQKRKYTELDRANKENENRLTGHQAGIKSNIFFLVLLASLNEFLCLLSLYFPLYYEYRSVKDKQVLTGETKTLSIDFGAFNSFIEAIKAFGLNGALCSLPYDQQSQIETIGFKSSNTGAGNTPTKPDLNKPLNPIQVPVNVPSPVYEDLQNYLKKYANVVECLEKGVSTRKTAKACQVSESTVHNVKRCLRNLNSAKIKG